MKTRTGQKMALATLCAAGAMMAFADPVPHSADSPAAATFDGSGRRVDVNVPSTVAGCTIEYSETDGGPWLDALFYTNACEAVPMFFRISAPGYETVVDSRPVTIQPKTLTDEYVWVEEPDGGYVYDGTAKEPAPCFGDGEPSILTDEDFDVEYEDNVNAGTAYAVFTGKRNYTGTVRIPFAIARAENAWTTTPAVADWTYGQTASEPVSAARHGTATVTWSTGAKPTTPGVYKATFTVPESRNYRELKTEVEFRIREAEIRHAAEGSSGDYNGSGFGIDVSVSAPATGATVKYAESPDGPWVDALSYTNVCEATPIYFRISAEGYATVTGSKTVTIRPKTLTEDYVWVESPDGGFVYDGTAKEPEPRFGDGEPSILTDEDFDVEYEDNIGPGTAYAVFTGKRNYTGIVRVPFEILGAAADVVLDAIGGRIGAAEIVTQSVSGVYGALPTAVRAGYSFEGWTLGVTNGAPAATEGADLLERGGHTLYARWEVANAESVFKWESADAGTARILGLRDTTSSIGNLVLPDRIGGLIVTEIADDAFKSLTNGIEAVSFPMFLERIGFRAFYNVRTLATLNIPSVRDWRNPSAAGSLSIGKYAFSSAALTEVRLPAEVAEIENYAFLNCQSLERVTILGSPTLGERPFRRTQYEAAGMTVRLAPALANDADYLAALTAEAGVAAVRTDAVVESVSVGALSVAPETVRLSVAVGRAADWGAVDASRVSVEYRESLGDAPTTLTPSAVTPQADGTLAVELAAPEGSSGFFRVKVEE